MDCGSERQLIFAILAVQNDLVDTSAATAVVESWMQDRSLQVREHLIDQGGLEADDAAFIERIVDRLVRKSGGDAQTALAKLSSVFGLSASFASLADEAGIEETESVAGNLRDSPDSDILHATEAANSVQSVADLARTVAGEPADGVSGTAFSEPSRNTLVSRSDMDVAIERESVVPSAEPLPGQRLGRFRIVRKLDKGGQGVIFEATDDTELNRRVAVKIIREDGRFSSDRIREARSRLAREGRINALLEHPNIIPVYGLGVTDEGRPYYAMRFLDKIDLQTAIRNFHAGLPLMHKPEVASALTELHAGVHRESPDFLRNDAVRIKVPPPRNEKALFDRQIRERDDIAQTADNSSDASVDPKKLVPVLRLDRLSGERNLAFRNLLERFTDVCDAIDYAHSRSVLHRDLKPVNIMLGEHGETLVIDWGLARTLDEIRSEAVRNEVLGDEAAVVLEVDDDYRLSKQGEFKGTLGHAPPEQLAGDLDSLDTRTDVYALGVILFEMLTGRQPFPREELLFVERKQWRATMLAWAMDGSPDPSIANPSVPRALAAICRKALSPSRDDRYASAAELAEEVENWLADEPVRVWRETPKERLARWARKNRGKSAALVATVALASLASVAGLLMQSRYTRAIVEERDRAQFNERRALSSERAERVQRDEAEKQRREAIANQNTSEYTTRFMVDLFRAADPIGMDGMVFRSDKKQSEMTVKELLSRGANKIDTEFQDRPEIRAHILRAIGQSFREISEFGQSERYLQENLSIVRDLPDPDPATVSDACLQLGRLYHYWAKYDQAEPYYIQAVEAIEKLGGKEVEESRAKVLFFIGWYYADQIDTLKAESYFGRAMEIYDRMLAERPNDTSIQRERTIVKLGIAACKLDSERVAEGVLEIVNVLPQIVVKSSERNMRAVTHFQIGIGFYFRKAYSWAESQFEKSLQYAASSLGLDHPYAAFVYYHLALVKEELGKFDEAESNFEKSFDLTKRTVTLSHPRAAFLVRSYAMFLHRRGKSKQAIALLDQMIDERRSDNGPQSFRVADALAAKAYHLYDIDDDQGGDDSMRQAVEIYDRQPGKWSFILDDVYESWAGNLAERHRYADAISYYDKIIELIRVRSQPEKVAAIQAEKHQVESEFARSLALVPGADPGNFVRAVTLARTASESEPHDGEKLTNLGLALYRTGEFAESAATLERALGINRQARDGVERPTDLAFLAMSYWRLGRKTEAESLYARLALALKRPEFARNQNSRQFLREATNLLYPQNLPDDPFQP
ncbi:tetratricopeptide repeat protein [bacterium]|nr:tetratricopeptide repeat protein [bacterium]